jgi:hypothetical protein
MSGTMCSLPRNPGTARALNLPERGPHVHGVPAGPTSGGHP